MVEHWYDILDEIDSFIEENRQHLIRRNIERLRIVSMIGIIVFVMGLATCYILVSSFSIEICYVALFVVLVLFHLLSARFKEAIAQHEIGAKAFTLGFYALSLACMLWIDVNNETLDAPLWFCVGLVVLSACYIDRFWVLFLLEIAEGIAGCIVINILDDTAGISTSSLAIIGSIFLFSCCYMMNLNLQADTGSDNKAIRQKSVTDLLTGLLNKIAFEDSCRGFLESRDQEKGCALIILDFDNFKHVNDNYGHQAGDEVLRRFGEILHDSFRVNDILGRVGGDEFMVMVVGSVSEDGITKRCDNILHELAICHIGGSDGYSCSIGIAIDERECGSDFAQLYAAADQALYRSKEYGKAQYQVEKVTD